MSEADLRAAFAPFGTIVDVSLPTKMDAQGRPQLRGFGFVEFSDLASATKVGCHRQRAGRATRGRGTPLTPDRLV